VLTIKNMMLAPAIALERNVTILCAVMCTIISCHMKIKLTPLEQERYATIRACIDLDITNAEAGARLHLTIREVRISQADIQRTIEPFFDGHNISFVYGRVLCGIELEPLAFELNRIVVVHSAF
jgi:hypothetical protein